MSRPLTIGFPYAADRFGGSTVSSLVLARALQDAGHKIHIMVHGRDGRIADEASTLGLAVTRLPALTGAPGYARPDRFRFEQFRALPASRAAIGQLGLDIVHSNDIAMLRGWSLPVLSTHAALVAHWRSNYRDSWSVKAALRVARAVIAVSRYSFEKLPTWVQAKGVVEYNAFNLKISPLEVAAARQEIRAALGIPAEAALVGVFGNLIRRKRAHVLADLIAAIPSTADGRPLYGIACGARAEPYDDLLDKKITEHGLESRLLRPGFVRPVEKWMAACDAVLAPAIDEPLARNVLEAQALGVPVVVSTDGGLRELINHGANGLLCDPFDASAWLAATRTVLNDRDLASKLAKNGRATVETLAPALHAQRIAAIYRGLFERPSRTEAA